MAKVYNYSNYRLDNIAYYPFHFRCMDDPYLCSWLQDCYACWFTIQDYPCMNDEDEDEDK